jgi:hypothetical protein
MVQADAERVDAEQDDNLHETGETEGQKRKTPKIRCWEHRGCEGIDGLIDPLSKECPHGRTDCYSPCKLECQFAQCHNPWHKVATDFNLLLDTTVDRSAAIKEGCRVCEFFLKYGPRLGEQEHRDDPETATLNSDESVTLQIF